MGALKLSLCDLFQAIAVLFIEMHPVRRFVVTPMTKRDNEPVLCGCLAVRAAEHMMMLYLP